MFAITDKQLAEWLEQADMPKRDTLGNWYDEETGLYFDKNCKRPIYEQLYQYYGKRVVFEEQRSGLILIVIKNSKYITLVEKSISKEMFSYRPDGNNEKVEWACSVCGISMKNS